jgi:transposase
LAPWASRRRKELLELLDQLDPKIAELTRAVEQEAQKRPEVMRLMTHPGVGPITGLTYVLVIGTPDRFPCSKKIGSYTGLIPSEDSSAGQQRLGHISKQGNALLRYLLGEAAQAAARCNSDWRLPGAVAHFVNSHFEFCWEPGDSLTPILPSDTFIFVQG